MTEASRRLVVPRVALAAAGVSAALLVGVLIWRIAAREPEAVAVATVDAAPPDAAVPPPDAPPDYDPNARPSIVAVTGTLTAEDERVELAVEVDLTIPPKLNPRDHIRLAVMCNIDGQWFEGDAFLPADQPGDLHERVTIRIGERYRLTKTPAACQLGIQHFGKARRHLDPWIAKHCFTGGKIADGECAPVPMRADGKPVIAILGVRVVPAPRLASVDQTVRLEYDVELRTALVGWQIRTTLTCRMPGGVAAHDVAMHNLYGMATGTPFLVRESMFGRDPLLAPPTDCTLELALADTDALVSEPIAVRCWNGSAVEPGPCPANP